ncbi:MAG: 1-acyl-sn-glycerol-3-phosphate acyltransferase [Thermoclostridium sp.]|nr:1-acyl-sn-glycerol-3-phosphate acyltransferase [Thermoclostridium sp.]
MASRQYYYSKWFNNLLRNTFGNYLLKRFHVRIYNEQIRDVKPPYIIISNHVGTWDPFILSMGVPDPVYFVISDAHFRHFWLRQVFKLVGGIPKAKQIADSTTIRAILSVIKNNGVIGLYPEGARNWDLKNIEVIYPTAKLIKSLKVPVVATAMEGAGLTKPRWARSSRSGHINLNYSLLLTPEQIKEMSVDEIYQKVVDGIHVNEYHWQEKNRVLFKGKNLAEYLDMFLVVCPRCKNLCSLYSHGNTLSCTHCGYAVDYDEYGYFSTKDEPYFLNPQTWSDWQSSWLNDLFSQSEYICGEKVLFSDVKTKLFTGKRRGKLRQYYWLGKVELFFDRIVFTPERGDNYVFPIDRITGVNVQNNNKFEFYYEDNLYRFKFTTQHKSVYKYELAFKLIAKMNEQKEKNQTDHA